MIRTVLVEDSRLARLELKELLKGFSQIEVLGEAENAGQALDLINRLNPDLLFLNIHLPSKSGFEILQELDRVPAVIFTTAFDQYAIQSFEYNTIDYLLKPIAPERLGKAILKAEEQLKYRTDQPEKREILTENDRIFVKDGKKCWFITLEKIRLFESKGNYTQIHFENNCPLILRSLQQIEDHIDPKQFVRINRAQIVNLKYIKDIAEWPGDRLKITLTTGEEVEVSRRQVYKIKDLYRI